MLISNIDEYVFVPQCLCDLERLIPDADTYRDDAKTHKPVKQMQQKNAENTKNPQTNGREWCCMSAHSCSRPAGPWRDG